MTAETGTEQSEAEKAWNALMERFGYTCDECGAPEGLMGTVSCSNCGYILPEARA